MRHMHSALGMTGLSMGCMKTWGCLRALLALSVHTKGHACDGGPGAVSVSKTHRPKDVVVYVRREITAIPHDHNLVG